MAVDPDCGGMHTPWETESRAYATKAQAIRSARVWAEVEGLQFFDDCPDNTDDAPDKSVTEQLQELFPGVPVITLGGEK